jgi:hypothetical protein
MKITTFEQFKRACIRGAWRGLRSQNFEQSLQSGGVSSEEESRCAYRGDGGRCCAIGWLAVVVPTEQGMDVDTALRNGLVLSPPLDQYLRSLDDRDYENSDYTAAHDFLWDLQLVHDEARDASHLRSRMIAFAKKHRTALPKD